MTATVVFVTSGKGGVGKTTTTANLAVALVPGGQEVDRLIGRRVASANEAKERLKRYIEIGRAAVRIAMTQKGREQRLVADISV